ncbi:glycosyltransferase family 39 protein [Micromonospora sp. NPDC049679]|uniref:glycosyltransferase family 39 protein n=1 Tax=Micromonospora sp. NPDC049679 TaxID=3155920 RepID=UPI0033CBF6AE
MTLKSTINLRRRAVRTVPAAATPTRPPTPRRSTAAHLARRLGRTVWLWPALLTLLVTAFRADDAELWRDELATWSAASRPADELLRLVGNIDAVSAPYYLFMHGWTALFGDSIVALRAPGILCMTAAAALTARLGARLFGNRVALIAGLLFAVLPTTSRYAQEARSYAFATLLAVVATLLLVRALDRPSWRRWLGYGAAVTALGLAHLVAVTLVAGHAVAVLLVWRRNADRRVLRWVPAVTTAGLALTPLLVLGVTQQGQQLEWVSRSRLSALPDLPGGIFQSAAVGGMVLGLAALGWALRNRWAHLLGMSALLPTALLFLAGMAMQIFVPRYLVFTVPMICLLAAAALATIQLRAAMLIVLAVCVFGAPAQAGLRRTHEWPRSAPREYSAAARIIGAHQRPGDTIVYGSRTGWAFLDTAVAYHLGDDRPRDVLATRSQTQRASLWASECAEPARCLAGADRVWVLTVGDRRDPLQGMARPKLTALRDAFTVDRVWPVPGLTVALLTRR